MAPMTAMTIARARAAPPPHLRRRRRADRRPHLRRRPTGSEMKAFSALDGVGLKLLERVGITVGVDHRQRRAGGRASRARARRRARLCRAPRTSCTPWEALRAELGLPRRGVRAHRRRPARPPDPPRCGLGVVGAARAGGGARGMRTTSRVRDGGAGAVREVCELILAAQGALERAARVVRRLSATRQAMDRSAFSSTG